VQYILVLAHPEGIVQLISLLLIQKRVSVIKPVGVFILVVSILYMSKVTSEVPGPPYTDFPKQVVAVL
jgi:hypothetical protein